MDVNQIFAYLTDGITDTFLLMILVVIDTVLGFSQAVKNNKKVTSKTLITGVVTNFILTLIPSAIFSIGFRHTANISFLNWLSAGYTVILAYGIIQSIMGNMNLLGIKLPTVIVKWLADELNDKEHKNNKEEGNNDESNKE